MQLKISFNLNKKSVIHIWVMWSPQNHTRNPSVGDAEPNEFSSFLQPQNQENKITSNFFSTQI